MPEDAHLANVLDIVENYFRPEVNLLAAERLLGPFTEDDLEFTEWSQVKRKCTSLEWNEENTREFSARAKEIVESGVTRISESYFDVTSPSNPTISDITDELNRNRLHEQESIGDVEGISDVSLSDLAGSSNSQPGQSGRQTYREGFQYTVDESSLSGSFTYTDISREIAPNGDVRRLIREGSIPFRVLPDDELLISETTSVIKVQKTKSIFKKHTQIDLVVCGNITADPEEGAMQMDRFRNSFPRGEDAPEDEPAILGTDEVKLYNPNAEGQNDVKSMDLEGNNIAGHPYITERLEEGWLVKGITSTVDFEGSIFEVTVAGSQTMGYAKVEGVGEYDRGRRLIDNVRDRYLQYLRTR